MAYRSRGRSYGGGYSRAPARRTSRARSRGYSGRSARPAARRATRARGRINGAREIRLVIEGAQVNPVSRFPGIAARVNPPTKKAKF